MRELARPYFDIRRFLSTAGHDLNIERRHRREEFLRIASLAGGVFMLIYSALFAILDFENLKYLVSATFLFSLLWLITPLVQRLGHMIAVVYIVAMVGISETVFNLIGGSDVSGHYFFLAAPAIIVMVVGPRQWLMGALIIAYFLVLFIFSESYLPERGTLATLSDGLALGSFVFCVVMSGVLNFMVVLYAFSRLQNAEEALALENERSENLLLNLVPGPIAERLKESPSEVIADYFPSATILFADIVDFTPYAARLSADEIVVFLNRVFSQFDALCEKHGLEKIKTIGDAYMVAGGVPEPMPDAAQAVARMALDMIAESDRLSKEFDTHFALRIGIHTGPVVAGVIGTRKLFYDLWGDAVNIAARMESHGRAGRIQVSKEAMDAIGAGFTFEEGGSRNIKGKGHTEVYFLTGEIRARPAPL